ncbi:putative N-acetyltransferase san [Zancudomyces culisetae]|uniref:N-alpha-acetyltransferase 60 n=1 Tax=Zancudomyces culisetae TaxID=1213189 RepID=A0A1R1PQI3_ZANCU|nr:putative N-acetyltransferase san [Zancudomyces culisetae]|eukprot:OMH83245.1 putative N-acetyltransferase san [Zancudomyces culisetae]
MAAGTILINNSEDNRNSPGVHGCNHTNNNCADNGSGKNNGRNKIDHNTINNKGSGFKEGGLKYIDDNGFQNGRHTQAKDKMLFSRFSASSVKNRHQSSDPENDSTSFSNRPDEFSWSSSSTVVGDDVDDSARKNGSFGSSRYFSLRVHDVTVKNIKILKGLNDLIFPIRYSAEFYNRIVRGEHQAKIVTLSDMIGSVGSIITRYQPYRFTEDYQRLTGGNFNASGLSEMKEYHSRFVATDHRHHQYNEAYIMTIGVLPMFRNLGIGTILLQNLIDQLRRNNDSVKNCKIKGKPAGFQTESIVLHVLRTNSGAIRFYTERFGFTKSELIKGYYKKEIDGCRDAYILKLKLL